jgi:hypothetical protein
MEKNTNINKVNTNGSDIENLWVSPTTDELNKMREFEKLVEIHDWIDTVCPVITYERYNNRPKRLHQEYREAYEEYLYEFENC